MAIIEKPSKIDEPAHSPDGKKRSGANAATLGGPLVMQVVLGGCAAENRGADFVNYLVPSLRARTR